jgi:hypothetical protein
MPVGKAMVAGKVMTMISSTGYSLFRSIRGPFRPEKEVITGARGLSACSMMPSQKIMPRKLLSPTFLYALARNTY